MAIKKGIRFEVFKRDKFTCQYCGRSAPDVTLHADHIHPKSKGGTDDILNLVTSCSDCNSGKSDKLLSDETAIAKRKQQLDDLQERREQLEMLMEWHRSLIDLDDQAVTELSKLWKSLIPGYYLKETSLDELKKWIKKYGVSEVIESMKASVEQYLEYEDTDMGREPIGDSMLKAFRYIPRIAASRKKMTDKPYLKDLYYIRGILRKRLNYVDDRQAITLMEDAVLAGVDIESIKAEAKDVRNWSGFRNCMINWTKELLA